MLIIVLAAPAQSYRSPARSFVYPLLGTRVSSNFGKRRHPVLRVTRHHGGIDLAAPDKATIRAIAEGVVIFADPHGSYGNLVVIRHADGMTSHYGHCEKLMVQPGQKIKAGQLIATVGHTGRTTGPHLHFEVRIDGKPQDPQKYIPGLSLEAEG